MAVSQAFICVDLDELLNDLGDGFNSETKIIKEDAESFTGEALLQENSPPLVIKAEIAKSSASSQNLPSKKTNEGNSSKHKISTSNELDSKDISLSGGAPENSTGEKPSILLNKNVLGVIYPSQCKSLHPVAQIALMNLRRSKTEIDSAWARFAATAAQTTGVNKRMLFPVQVLMDIKKEKKLNELSMSTRSKSTELIKDERVDCLSSDLERTMEPSVTPCFVLLNNLGVKNVSPWCMVHEQYDCELCGLSQPTTDKNLQVTSTNISPENLKNLAPIDQNLTTISEEIIQFKNRVTGKQTLIYDPPGEASDRNWKQLPSRKLREYFVSGVINAYFMNCDGNKSRVFFTYNHVKLCFAWNVRHHTKLPRLVRLVFFMDSITKCAVYHWGRFWEVLNCGPANHSMQIIRPWRCSTMIPKILKKWYLLNPDEESFDEIQVKIDGSFWWHAKISQMQQTSRLDSPKTYFCLRKHDLFRPYFFIGPYENIEDVNIHLLKNESRVARHSQRAYFSTSEIGSWIDQTVNHLLSGGYSIDTMYIEGTSERILQLVVNYSLKGSPMGDDESIIIANHLEVGYFPLYYTLNEVKKNVRRWCNVSGKPLLLNENVEALERFVLDKFPSLATDPDPIKWQIFPGDVKLVGLKPFFTPYEGKPKLVINTQKQELRKWDLSTRKKILNTDHEKTICKLTRSAGAIKQCSEVEPKEKSIDYTCGRKIFREHSYSFLPELAENNRKEILSAEKSTITSALDNFTNCPAVPSTSTNVTPRPTGLLLLKPLKYLPGNLCTNLNPPDPKLGRTKGSPVMKEPASNYPLVSIINPSVSRPLKNVHSNVEEEVITDDINSWGIERLRLSTVPKTEEVFGRSLLIRNYLNSPSTSDEEVNLSVDSDYSLEGQNTRSSNRKPVKRRYSRKCNAMFSPTTNLSYVASEKKLYIREGNISTENSILLKPLPGKREIPQGKSILLRNFHSGKRFHRDFNSSDSDPDYPPPKVCSVRKKKMVHQRMDRKRKVNGNNNVVSEKLPRKSPPVIVLD